MPASIANFEDLREMRVWQRSLDVHGRALGALGGVAAGAARGRLQPAQAGAAESDRTRRARATSGRRRQACRCRRASTRSSRRETPAERDNYELLSAEQWVLAGDTAAAKQAFAAGLARGAHDICRPRARWSPRKSRSRRMTGHGPFMNWTRYPCPRRRSSRRTIGGCAARARFSPAIRSRARAPSSSASAIFPIRRACARAATSCSL